MSETLQDPTKPAGAIVKLFEDGDALRNDGVRLQAAKKNPWYVMATIFGEQEEGSFEKGALNEDLAAKNRRAWNGWACVALTDDQRAEAMKTTGLSEEDLAPLSGEELAEVQRRFEARMGAGAEMPQATKIGSFETTYFAKPLGFEKYVVSKLPYFGSSHFAGAAYFGSSHFAGAAYFGSSHFAGAAYFGSSHFAGASNFRWSHFAGVSYFHLSHFSGGSDFRWSHFTGDSYFDLSHFSGNSDFHSTHFAGNSDFGSSHFAGAADFSSATFKGKTKFNNAKFKNHVPEFYEAELFDDTTFTLPDNPLKNWPPLKGKGVMPAEDQKRAYNRLRLFMNRALQIDEEQFFHRQEMRCKRKEAGWLHKPFYALFSGLSDYGISVWRPILALCSLIAISTVLMAMHFGQPTLGFIDLTMGLKDGVPKLEKWAEALGWSIANTFPFFGFNGLYFGSSFAENLPWWLKTLGGVQTAFSFILLFLLGLGLRNRFRLR